jgi:hypothetical protein
MAMPHLLLCQQRPVQLLHVTHHAPVINSKRSILKP